MLLESLDFPGGSQGGNLQRNFSAGVTSLHSNMSTNCLGVRNCTELEANKYERSKRREGKKKEDSHKVIQKCFELLYFSFLKHAGKKMDLGLSCFCVTNGVCTLQSSGI
ncbi:uncharacterized protein LOC143666273 isoform X3 [Tamandua tetradactyla]|uniref:uncharacterized protein LOC143666273 isoform X3 n=1 Tax=Tamandua tetradactyla TaxID=48850 RepID=UPI004053F8F6